MKKYLSKLTTMWIVLFVLGFTTACNAQLLKIVWNSSVNADFEHIEYYKVFVFEGDSIQWQNFIIANMDSVSIVGHIMGDPLLEYEYRHSFQLDAIIRAGLIAVDSLTRESDMVFSPFYFSPNYPENVRIEK